MLLVTGLALYPAAPNLWALAVVIPFVPVGTALLFPATTSLLSARASQAEVGTVMGIAQTFAGIARVIAPVAATSASSSAPAAMCPSTRLRLRSLS